MTKGQFYMRKRNLLVLMRFTVYPQIEESLHVCVHISRKTQLLNREAQNYRL